MISYASVDNVIDAWGQQSLKEVVPDDEGNVDQEAVMKALERASVEIDARRENKEFPAGFLKAAAVDIAFYFLSRQKGQWSEASRQRYEDVMAILKARHPGETKKPPTSGGIHHKSTPRRFNRDTL